MHSLIADSPEWLDAEPHERQAVDAWLQTLPIHGGMIISLLYGNGGAVVEFQLTQWSVRPSDGLRRRDVTMCACTCDPPPPAFYVCARRITPPDLIVPEQQGDVLAEMGGAWSALSWQMLLEVGRRARVAVYRMCGAL